MKLCPTRLFLLGKFLMNNLELLCRVHHKYKYFLSYTFHADYIGWDSYFVHEEIILIINS